MTNQLIDRPLLGEETPLAVIEYIDQLEARIDAMQACINTFEPVLENVRAVEGDFFERYSEYLAYRKKYDAVTLLEACFIGGEEPAEPADPVVWVRTSEQLPPSNTQVLVDDGGEFLLATFYGDRWHYPGFATKVHPEYWCRIPVNTRKEAT